MARTASPETRLAANGSKGSSSLLVAIEVAKERGLPQLHRGWRTPDPSPSRGVAEMPPCRPWSWCCTEEDQEERQEDVQQDLRQEQEQIPIEGSFSEQCSASAIAASSSIQLGTDASRRGRSPVRRSSSLTSSSASQAGLLWRTPSPSPSSSVSALATAHQDDSPAGMKTSCSRASCGSTVYPESECSADFCALTSVQADQRMFGEAGKAPVPPAVKPVAAWSGPSVPPPPPCAPVLREVLGLPDDCPSIGSLNHPHGCADFCKYAKKAKGCKDGDACIRCHICTRRKPRMPFQFFRQSAGSSDSFESFKTW